MAYPWIRTLVILAAGSTAQTYANDELSVPTGLVVEGAPSVPLADANKILRYNNFQQTIFLDWHPVLRKILVSLSHGGGPQLNQVPSPGLTPQQLTLSPDSVREAQYQPKFGTFLVFSKDHDGDELYQFYRQDLPTGQVALLTDGRSRNVSMKLSRDGLRLAYASTARNGVDLDLWIMDPRDPSSRHILSSMHGGGLSVGDWSPNCDFLVVTDSPSIAESILYIVDTVSGRKTLLTRTRPGTAISWTNPKFSKDGKAVYVESDKDSEFRGLIRLTLTGRIEEHLTAKIPWDVDDYDLSPDGRSLAYTVNANGVSQLHVRSLITPHEHVFGNIPQGTITGLRFRGNSRDLGFSISTAQIPLDAFSLDVETGQLDRWTVGQADGQAAQQFLDPNVITWRSFDKRSISGLLYLPPRHFTGKHPVVIDIHGGPEDQARVHFLGSYNYALAELGVAYIFPNIRGSTGYGKTFTSLDNGLKREDAVRDIGALLDWVRSRPELDAARVLVGGNSYGGYVALATGTLYGNRLLALIDLEGPSNLVTLLENTAPYRRDLRRAEYGDERDPKVRSYLEEIAPINHLAQVTVPLLVAQGLNDPVVPYSESVRLVCGLRTSNNAVWFFLAKDEGHGFSKKENRDYLLVSSVQFLSTYLLTQHRLPETTSIAPPGPDVCAQK